MVCHYPLPSDAYIELGHDLKEKKMLMLHVSLYTSGAVQALTIEDAITALHYEVKTGASYFAMLR